MTNEPKWLEWAKKLQAIAQGGLEYSKDKYDIERFEQIREITVDIMANYTDIDHEKIKDLFANESGYQTPKIDVRAAVFKDNNVLLVNEKIDGLWSMPGGWADVDTTLKETVIKECMEEAGVLVKPKRIIAVIDRKKNSNLPFPYAVYKIFVECEYIKGEYINNIETSEAKFFPLDKLPPLSLGRVNNEQIKMCYEASNKNMHEAIFD